ncbi:YdgA family protein [Pseudomonas sp. dw_358]|uniref:YdgA family protein n=1 Tax=Pseudomonas sp. dw_358 TaxID=2720083 RepID=UPI001BD1DB24|nr:YdgA family protein [Pseudomonas sp. dw_358]
MSKAVKVIAGIVIVVGAVASGGAWYTGTRVEGVIRDAVEQANHELAQRMVGDNGPAHLDVVSVDRHVFSSDIRYKLVLEGAHFRVDGKPLELDFADHLEHGPLPWSRVRALDLVPVMVASHFDLVRTPTTEKWFAATHDAAPLQGRAVVGYDRNTVLDIKLLPFAVDDAGHPMHFSGATAQVKYGDDGKRLDTTGSLDALQLTLPTRGGPMNLQVNGFTFSSGGTKGRSGFYLGHTDGKVALLSGQVQGQPAIQFKDFTSASLLQEVDGNLAGQVNYDVGMINVGGKEVGSSHMAGKFSNFDITASQALVDFYQTKVLPQAAAAQAARAGGQPYDLHLTDADQLQLSNELTALLAGKPHVELENLSLKTTHGESQASLMLDLTNPGTFDQPADDLYKKMVAEFKAQVLLSKPMIGDLVTLQAQSQGMTDPAALAKQAQGTADGVAGMAQVFGLAKVEGDNIVSRLHYVDGMVDFNGQKMTPEQFAAVMMAKVGQLAPH